MSGLETARIAARALWRNKLRSFLTGLGVMIGVAAVIAMVAIGEGAKAKVEETFASMGSNLLIVMPGSTNSGGARGGFGSMPSITWDDMKAIQSELPVVKAAAPQLRSTGQILSDDQNWTTSVYGTSPEYFDIRNWGMQAGEAFSTGDVEAQAKVVVLGQTVVEKLFGPGADVVGKSVRIKSAPYVVVGVMEKKGQSPTGQDYDDAAFVPYTTFRTRIQGGLQNYLAGAIFVSAHSATLTQKAEGDIRRLLRDRHRLEEGTDDDFFVRNMTEMASAQAQGTETLTALLASVAAVSLLIGGIGIMNIMLVSVTERTREIGIRMAVGARPRDILAQFLVEALTLGLAGGLVGVALGIFAAQKIASNFGWSMLVRPDIIVLAVGFSALVGVVFGMYPARKASRLDPIEALRYE